MQTRLISLLLLAAVLPACEPFAAPISGSTLVIDGDSLEIGETSIRLFGVDAFEGRQTCRRDGVIWRCGEAAADKLAELVGKGQLVCTKKDIDTYGRTVARCTVGSTDLAAELARAGLALAYRQYSDDYIDEEDEARAAQRRPLTTRRMAPASVALTRIRLKHRMVATSPGRSGRLSRSSPSHETCTRTGEVASRRRSIDDRAVPRADVSVCFGSAFSAIGGDGAGAGDLGRSAAVSWRASWAGGGAAMPGGEGAAAEGGG